MNEPTDNHKQSKLRRRLERNSYTVDPQRVAGALIVRLVQESVAPRPPATGGPTRASAWPPSFVKQPDALVRPAGGHDPADPGHLGPGCARPHCSIASRASAGAVNRSS